jgi:hypothetical protein
MILGSGLAVSVFLPHILKTDISRPDPRGMTPEALSHPAARLAFFINEADMPADFRVPGFVIVPTTVYPPPRRTALTARRAPRLSGRMMLKGHGVVQAVTTTARFPFCFGAGMPLAPSFRNTGTLRSKRSFSGADMLPQCVGVPTTRASASRILPAMMWASSRGKTHAPFSLQAIQALQYFMSSVHTSIHSTS